MNAKFTMRRGGTRRLTMAVKHHIGSREIAIVLLTKGAEGTDMTRAQVLDLVRDVAQERGGQGLFPDCGVDVDGYEEEFAGHAKWASDTVRRLWPDLDDEELRLFDEQYVDLTGGA